MTFSMDRFRLDGRVALVTGAGRGIGLAIAQTLSMAGARVAIQDIDLDVAQEQSRLLDRSIAIGGDARSYDDAKHWVEQTKAALGPIDILINNASIQNSHHLEEWSTGEVDDILRANVGVPWRSAPAMQ